MSSTSVPAGTGLVVIRSTLPDANAMVQRVDGPAGAADQPMARGSDGTLTAAVAPGTYQVVAWQGDIARTNQRNTTSVVNLGATASFTYTAAALTRDLADVVPPTNTGPVTPAPVPDGGITVTPVSSTPAPVAAAERREAYLRSLTEARASRTALILFGSR